MHRRQTLYLSPAVERVICHYYDILQLVTIEVHGLERQNRLPLQVQLAPFIPVQSPRNKNCSYCVGFLGAQGLSKSESRLLTGRCMVSSWWPCSDRMLAELAPAARMTLGMPPLRSDTASSVGTTCM